MRSLHWVRLDKRRPALLLTRELMVGRMSTVTVAPVSTTVHGIATELLLGVANGLDQRCAAKLDQVTSIPVEWFFEPCGWLLDAQEAALQDALQAAYDLV